MAPKLARAQLVPTLGFVIWFVFRFLDHSHASNKNQLLKK